MSNTLMNWVKQQIKEQTCDLDTPEYVEFLRELAEWATSAADVAEYVAEGDFGNDD